MSGATRHAQSAAPPHPISRVVALIVLLLLAPAMLLIAFAIVLDSGLPVFFRQERLGVHGQRFWMLKFRKFRATVGRETTPLTLANDPRCTRVGGWLGRARLDELPQLWNVVRGDMALVGPRPEVPEFEACFAGRFHQLLEHRPGIFGPGQAASCGEATLYPPDRQPQDFYREVLFPAKATLDLAYYPARTVFGDLKWVWRGMLAVCGAKRAKAVSLLRRAGKAPA
jgi:lipopolysaccharide/colanic/teichoic acid biosynthesis glycosyltransferase